jgi:hypothetical protein
VSIALLVDANSWLGLSPRATAESEAAYDATAEILMQAGWRVVRVRHGDALPQLWASAGQRTGNAVASPAAGGGGGTVRAARR